MTYSSGNKDRDARAKRSIAECRTLREDVTLANVADKLPKDFDLDQEELDGFLADQPPQLTPRERADARAKATPPLEHAGPLLIETLPNGTPVPQAAPETLDKIGSPHASATEQPHQDAADEAPGREITPAEARHLLEVEKRGLDAARERLLVAQHTLKELRGELHNARMVWARLDQPSVVSMEAQARTFIANSQAEARARKLGKVRPQPENRPGPSVIDRSAFYAANKHDAADAARARFGFGSGYHRGAYPGKSGMAKLNFDPRRGPVAKVPGAQ